MKTGPEGIALLHNYEGCRLRAYPDPATGGKPWTIGYGDVAPDVVPGLVITQAEADARFARRLAREFEPGVQALLMRKPTQGQFDALVSFAYNLGLGNLRTSTLLRYFNEGRVAAAGLQFLSWDRAAGRRMLGLTRRRNAEKWVFEGVPAADAIARAAKIVVA